VTRLNGTVVLLTGTARGQGRAAALRAEPDTVRLTAWPHLARSRGCIRTGSTAGVTGSRTDQLALTRQRPAEGTPHGIRANCVRPGMVDTPGPRADLLADLLADEPPMRAVARHIPLGRLGRPDAATYTTGAHLVVDDGWSAVLPGATPRKDSPA
jgi:NAD(P)-dependent dehydrogenase (short-subunit alcohol dehydrogenase family)